MNTTPHHLGVGVTTTVGDTTTTTTPNTTAMVYGAATALVLGGIGALTFKKHPGIGGLIGVALGAAIYVGVSRTNCVGC